jgi:hypothetical protein
MRRSLGCALLVALSGGMFGCDDKKTTAPATGTGTGMIAATGAPAPPPPPPLPGR